MQSGVISFVTSMFNGWRENVYKPDHVLRMKDMIAEHYHKPHKFYCVSDEPIAGVETVPIWDCPIPPLKGIPSSYFRLFLFSGQAIPLFGRRVVSIDLDGIILKNITGLFGTNEPFKILEGVSNPYNGSLWQVTPGTYPELWADLDVKLAAKANAQKAKNGKRFYGSDQAVMAYRLPRSPTWSEADGVFQFRGDIPQEAKIMFFTGLQKPWQSKFAPLYWGDKAKRHG